MAAPPTAEFAVARQADPAVLDASRKAGGCRSTGSAAATACSASCLADQGDVADRVNDRANNHFIELQQVEAVSEAARRSASRPADHAPVPRRRRAARMGVLFGARKRHAAVARADGDQAALPLWLAPARRRSCAHAPRSSGRRAADERDSVEGERLCWPPMAMNYGFAFRLATFATLDAQAAGRWVRPGAADRRLAHNTIYEEHIGGRRAIVHRPMPPRLPGLAHGHHPVFGRIGQPVLLPGTSHYPPTCASPARAPSRPARRPTVPARRSTSSREPDGRPMTREGSTLRFRYAQREPVAVPSWTTAASTPRCGSCRTTACFGRSRGCGRCVLN